MHLVKLVHYEPYYKVDLSVPLIECSVFKLSGLSLWAGQISQRRFSQLLAWKMEV